MCPRCFIGIDQGSSSTKAIALSEEGQVLFQTRHALPAPVHEGVRVESDGSSILKSVEGTLKETVESVTAAGFTAAALGLSCQRSSCLVWNRETREPLSPVISWRDLRGTEFVHDIEGRTAFIFETTGLPLTPYYSASKLKWLKENTQTASGANAVFGTLGGFLVQRLCRSERPLVDHTHAARTQLMNIKTLAWDPSLLELFSLTDVTLPDIVPVVHEFGGVDTPSGSVPLVASIGDQQAAMIGLGVLEEGDGGINYGTGGFLIVNTGKKLITRKGLMSSIHYSDASSTRFLVEGSVNAAGDALEWLRTNLHLFSNYDDVDDLCWQAATDVVAFIGLNGTGSPHWENHISSGIYGLGPGSTSADIVRAAVEGIAFFVKDIAEEIREAGFEPRGFEVSGGLSSLTYMTQVQADLLGTDLHVSTQREVSALGAALLAGIGQGSWTPQAVKSMARSGETVSPRRNAGAEKRYRRWQELHRAVRDLDRI